MGLNIYQKVVEIIGELPTELEFIYAICTVLLFSVLIFIVVSPFVILYKLSK